MELKYYYSLLLFQLCTSISDTFTSNQSQTLKDINDNSALLVSKQGNFDSFLFDDSRRSILNWERRYEIINGISRGLLYRHQDSRLRIIHRDLKTSNILLGAEMTPKISDFNICRGSTEKTKKVVGTYGYMSPEYAVYGKFSTKSDVWHLWKEGTALEIFDSSLESYQRDEVLRCIHVGLVCARGSIRQASNVISCVHVKW